MTDRETVAILSENIQELSEQLCRGQRKRTICTEQLIGQVLSKPFNSTSDAALAAFRGALPTADAADCAHLLLRMAEMPEQFPELTSETVFRDGEPPADEARGQIALVRNPYTEQALRHFSRAFEKVGAYYAPSFADACEEVFDGRCAYCILPVGDSPSGRLLGIYALLDRYDLKICALVELETDSDAGSVRYALAGKHQLCRRDPHEPWFLEGFIVEELKQFPREFFSLIEIFDAAPIGFDSMTVSYSDRLQRFYFALCVPYSVGGALEACLSAVYPQYTRIGFYPCMEMSPARKESLII